MSPLQRKFVLLSLIFIAALLLRVSTALLLPRHLGPDAPDYMLVAEHITSYLKGTPLEDNERFLSVAGRRGWLYPLFIALMSLLVGQQYYLYAVGGVQILLDSFICIVMYFIGKRFFSERVACLVAALTAIYPSLIYYSKFISQEATMTFLLVLFVYVMTAIGDDPTRKNHFFAGVCLGFITFYRPSYQLLFVFFLPLFAYRLKRFNQKNWRVLVASFVAGLMVVIVGWVAFSYKVNKQIMLYKSSIFATYETLRNDGWVTDDYFPVVDANLHRKLLTMGYSPPHQGTLLDFDHELPASVYFTLGLQWIKDHPVDAVSQMLNRIYRIWFYIDTYPAKWHSAVTGIQLLFHRLLIVLSIIAIPLSLAQWRLLWIVYLLVAYTNVHILAVGIPRYNVPSMPFVLLLASYALVTIIEKAKVVFSPVNRRIILYISGFVVSALIGYLPSPISIGIALSLVPFLQPEYAYYLKIMMLNMNFIILAWVLYRYLKQEGSKKVIPKTIVFIALSLPFLNNTLLTNKTWDEWWCTLQDRNSKVVHKIYLPQDLDISPSTQADLFIDMMSGKGKDYTLVVKVNGRKVKSYIGGLKSDREKFEKRFSGLYVYFFFNTYRLRPEDLRQWYQIPLDSTLLTINDPVEIECYLEGNPDGQDNYVYVFGDYSTERLRHDNNFEGPTIPQTNQDTSLFKIMPYEGDSRFESRMKLQSEKRESFFCRGDACQANNLSDAPGIQRGTYRIRIRLLDGAKKTFL